MKRLTALITATAITLSGAAMANDKSDSANEAASFLATYEVTVTNLTKGQYFTPLIVATHSPRIRMFMVGEAPSDALSRIAEGGATDEMAMALADSGMGYDIQFSTNGLIGPGESRTVTVEANLRRYNRVSLAGMLLPTNDTFVALDALRLEKHMTQQTAYANAYDAGSEMNDESCAHIPGPIECGGVGQPFSVGLAEGYVYPSPGIHGMGDLDPAMYDWRGPVAMVKVVRID